MPLRDHFHTNSTLLNWEGVHASWPTFLAMRLNTLLPEEFVVRPRLHTGAEMEAELPEPSEYEVNRYTQDEFRLVATIELVSPSNNDRSENR